MKKIIALVSLSVTLFAPLAANAAGECDKYTTSYDKTYCFAKLFLASDKELNDAYKNLQALIKDPVKQQLKLTQRDWIKYRNSSCSSQGMIDVDCNYKVNRERIEYLNDRIRECKTGNCRNEMISKPSWS